MKPFGLLAAAGAFVCVQLGGTGLNAADTITGLVQPDISFRNEVQLAIDRGLAWLTANQNSNGWWSSPDHPALTALPLTAYMGEPTEKFRKAPTSGIKKGYAWLLASAQPDGSIFRDKLINYNTSISVMAFVAARNSAYDDVLRRARGYLTKSQLDLDQSGQADHVMDGGFGYSHTNTAADLSNTILALEAMRASERVVRDSPTAGARDLNWDAAIRFLQQCQNLRAYNGKASTDPNDAGGFYYDPTSSKAGGTTNSEGRVSLRSYGSMSYAGLLSYIYADLKSDDPRVTAVTEWLRANYTLEENPGMGQQGYYYYLHAMTKALIAARQDQVELKDGRKVDWRREVAMRLLNLQKQDGSWSNSNNRWMEQDPCLVTSYALLSLEMLWHRL
jgi:squalene-hopene/tetraprenyl-beta-curcumene cyclase